LAALLFVVLPVTIHGIKSSAHPQSGTDYSANDAARHVHTFLQDERSAAIKDTSCTWSATLNSTQYTDALVDCPEGQIVTGVECVDTNCNNKRLKCCDVSGRYKECTATYDGAIVLSPWFGDQDVGTVGSKAKGGYGVDSQLNMPEPDFQNFFVMGMACKGKHCAKMQLRLRRLYCTPAYIIENEADEMSGNQRACHWTKWFSNEKRVPVPPPRNWESKKGTSLTCPKNMFVSGADCRGATCDHVRLYCCHFGHVCPIGTYGNNMQCTFCPRGRFGATPGLLDYACTANCPKGKYAPYLGTSKPECPAYHSAISVTGDANDPFQPPNNGGRTGTRDCCIDCPAGRYIDTEGNDDIWDCKECPMGKYGQTDGLTSSACTANCPIGRYRDRVGGKIPADCYYCPPGTWGQTTGLSTDKCTNWCPPGKYNSRVGQTTVIACTVCPRTFTGSKAPWGEQCPHRMPTRAIGRGVTHPKFLGVDDTCGNPLGVQGPALNDQDHTGNYGTSTKCFGDFVDYGKSHPKVNSHNGKEDSAFYLTRMGYPRFCDSKTMCLNVGPFKKSHVPGASFPGGEATTKWMGTGGTLTPEKIVENKKSGDHGDKSLGVSESDAQKKRYYTHYTGHKVEWGFS
jgi:hypothetical protein